MILNKNTWGVKKCEAKKNQRLKALISNKAHNNNFYFKDTQQFTPNHDWLCHPWPPFFIGGHAKKVAKDDKANHGWENTL